MRRKRYWLTAKQLRDIGACYSFRRRFRKRFPTGRVEVTLPNAERYCALFGDYIATHGVKLLDPRRSEVLKAYCDTLAKEELISTYNRERLCSKRAQRMAKATAWAKLYIAQCRYG